MHLIHRGIVNKNYKENILNSFKVSFKKGYGVETDIHVIASPLGNRDLKRYCGYTHPKSKNHNVSYFQWRTIQKLDNAFNSFDYDPQIIDFEESSVFRLPANYNGRRLGHLWSISWVAEKILENEPQN